MKIEFTCLGSPIAQKRHRSTRVGKFIRNYDPSAPDKADFLGLVHKYAPEHPFLGTLKLRAYFYINYPKKWLRTGKFEGQLKENHPKYCPTRPDVDNYLKFVMDAMGNGIFYNDDSKIALVEVAKKYSLKPRTEITIEELNDI
jgi:Holliday junction resolvase RusA-like endonuclease